MAKRYEKAKTVEEIAVVPDSENDFSDIPGLDDVFWKSARLVQRERQEDSELNAIADMRREEPVVRVTLDEL